MASGRKRRSRIIKPSLPVPKALCRRISWLAVFYAREYMKRRGWKGGELLRPVWRSDTVGIHVPPELSYLFYQNNGTRPFIPWTLEGRIIPIPAGQFRTARGVGVPGWIHDWRPGRYGHEIWKEAKWANPGVKPTWFLDRAIGRALERYRGELEKYPKGREWLCLPPR